MDLNGQIKFQKNNLEFNYLKYHKENNQNGLSKD